jgi:hypothetical protein
MFVLYLNTQDCIKVCEKSQQQVDFLKVFHRQMYFNAHDNRDIVVSHVCICFFLHLFSAFFFNSTSEIIVRKKMRF